MSALPKPEPEPTPVDQGDAEGWALLEGLRRRLEDQAVQGRKTQQQVTQLAESIGALVETQRRRSRYLNLNSFVAYMIFTLLCGAGFYFLYTSRAHELVTARDTAQRERDAATKRADDATAKLAAREQADARAWEVYQLLEANKRSEAMTKLDAIGALPVSRTERAVLAARAHETQVMEVDAALKQATTAFKQGRHADAIPQLEAALVGEPSGARAAAMRYYLGVAYAKSGQLDKAITNLTTALDVEADHEDVRFQLASALDRSGQYGKARVEYSKFATAHPVSSFTAFALRRAATLARMPAVAPAQPAAAAPAPTPAAPAAATPAAPAAATPAAPKPAAPKPAAPKPAAPKPTAPATETESPPSPLPPAQPAPGTTLNNSGQWNNVPSAMVALSTAEALNAADKSTDKSADKSNGKSADKSNDKPADKSHDKPHDKPGDKSNDKPHDKPAHDKLPPVEPPTSALPSQPGIERWPEKPAPPDRTPPPEVATPKPGPKPPITPPIERVNEFVAAE